MQLQFGAKAYFLRELNEFVICMTTRRDDWLVNLLFHCYFFLLSFEWEERRILFVGGSNPFAELNSRK